MDNNNNSRNHSASMAFVIGAIAGGVAALLLAPESGKQLRTRIRSRATDVKDHARETVGHLREKAESVTSTVKGAASEARHAYRDEADKRRQPDTEQVARRTGA
jgi:gas vesicle protein